MVATGNPTGQAGPAAAAGGGAAAPSSPSKRVAAVGRPGFSSAAAVGRPAFSSAAAVARPATSPSRNHSRNLAPSPEERPAKRTCTPPGPDFATSPQLWSCETPAAQSRRTVSPARKSTFAGAWMPADVTTAASNFAEAVRVERETFACFPGPPG